MGLGPGRAFFGMEIRERSWPRLRARRWAGKGILTRSPWTHYEMRSSSPWTLLAWGLLGNHGTSVWELNI